MMSDQPPGYGVGESAGKKTLGAVSEKGGSGCQGFKM